MKKYINLTVSIIISIVIMGVLINIIPPIDAIAVNPFNTGKMQCITKTSTGSHLPPNTMLSFNSAANYGSTIFYINVIMTEDEQLIIADIDELSVYTSETGKISEKTYEELSTLNFAYNFSSDSTTYPYRAQKHSCVKLEDLIAYYPYTDYVIGIIQTGEQGLRASVLLSEILRKNDMSMRCVIRGDETVIDYFRNEKNIHVLTVPIDNELEKFLFLDMLHLSSLYSRIDFQFISIPISKISDYSLKTIKSLKDRNVSVYIDDVNTEEDYQLAVTYEPSGIITSNPELINKLTSTDTVIE